MKKILIIDDKLSENKKTGNTSYMSDNWKRLLHHSDLADVASLPDIYFDWDSAGNYCNLKFDINDYAIVFIHHSQQGDSIIPSNILDLIKVILRERLVLFSGAIQESYLNNENSNFPFRSIVRKKLEDKMPEFLKKSILLNEWIIEILFFDYEKSLIGKIIEFQDQEKSHKEILESKEMKHLLTLKHVRPNSQKFEQLRCHKGYNLIEELRQL